MAISLVNCNILSNRKYGQCFYIEVVCITYVLVKVGDFFYFTTTLECFYYYSLKTNLNQVIMLHVYLYLIFYDAILYTYTYIYIICSYAYILFNIYTMGNIKIEANQIVNVFKKPDCVNFKFFRMSFFFKNGI